MKYHTHKTKSADEKSNYGQKKTEQKFSPAISYYNLGLPTETLRLAKLIYSTFLILKKIEINFSMNAMLATGVDQSLWSATWSRQLYHQHTGPYDLVTSQYVPPDSTTCVAKRAEVADSAVQAAAYTIFILAKYCA